MITVIKKDGTRDNYNPQKIIDAIRKSAERVLVELTPEEEEDIISIVSGHLYEDEAVDVSRLHRLVEGALEEINPKVAKSYRDYRNYKSDHDDMLRHVHEYSDQLQFLGDRSNANTDSALVSTHRSLVYTEIRSEEYKRFFLNAEERQAMKDGYIYIHDRGARLDTMNCSLFDISNVLKGGFEMGNVWYNEPKTVDTCFDVISDVTLSGAAMQYGGFTLPRVDSVIAPYARKSYEKYKKEYVEMAKEIYDGIEESEIANKAETYAMSKVQRDIEQGVQGLEYKFNTVGSSRGDYPFIAVSFGIETDIFGQMVSSAFLKIREGGQGAEGKKRPVLFPKLTFLYDKNLHGEGKPLEHLFDLAIECSSKCMYPDFLSLTGEGYIPSVYKKYGEVVSLMG